MEYLWLPLSFLEPGGPAKVEAVGNGGVVTVIPVSDSGQAAHSEYRYLNTLTPTIAAARTCRTRARIRAHCRASTLFAQVGVRAEARSVQVHMTANLKTQPVCREPQVYPHYLPPPPHFPPYVGLPDPYSCLVGSVLCI